MGYYVRQQKVVKNSSLKLIINVNYVLYYKPYRCGYTLIRSASGSATASGSGSDSSSGPGSGSGYRKVLL